MTKRFLIIFTLVTLVHGLLIVSGKFALLESGPAEDSQSTLRVVIGEVSAMKVTATPKKTRAVPSGAAPSTRPGLPTPEPEPSEATPGGPAGAANLSGALVGEARNRYTSLLRADIDAQKYYPVMSKRLRQTGTVLVSFTVEQDGKIVNLRVSKSSRFDRLDAAAMDAVKKIGKRPIPTELGESSIDITVPVQFTEI